MGKTIKENCRNISIYQFKEWGCFKSDYHAGSVVWTSYDNKKNSVNYVIDLRERRFKLDYRIRSWGDEEWQDMNHTYPLVATPCNYGGLRWWFICSVYRSGVYCGRRVAKLYLGSGSNYFACRHCYDLSYGSRNKNYKGKYTFLTKFFDISKDIENLEKQIKIPIRAGRQTKKYTRLLKKERILGVVSKFALATFGKY